MNVTKIFKTGHLMNKFLSIFAILAIAITLSAVSCSDSGDGSDSRQIEQASDNRELAHNFELESLRNSTTYSLEQFRGKPVILNFWASWCPPCKKEMPLLESSWNSYRDKGIKIIGINVMDDRSHATALVDQFDITYLNLFDRGNEVSRSYGVVALPVTVFIDSEGRIVRKHFGPYLGDDGKRMFLTQLEEIIDD